MYWSGGQSHGVDALVPQFQELHGVVRDDAENVAGDMGFPFVVVGVGRQDDLLVGLPFLELVGAGSDGTAVGGVAVEIPGPVDVAGKDAHHPRLQAGREGFLIEDAEGQGVRCFDFLHPLVVSAVGRAHGGVGQLLEGELDVIGSDGGAVVPLEALPEVEDDLQAAAVHLPGLGQVPRELQILVVFDQAIEDQPADLVGSRIGGQDGVQAGGVPQGGGDVGVPVDRLGRGGAGRDRYGILPAGGEEDGGERSQEPAPPCSLTRPFGTPCGTRL